MGFYQIVCDRCACLMRDEPQYQVSLTKDKEAQDKARDEQLWTEYAKAALQALIGAIPLAPNLNLILADADANAVYLADAMLTAHKKRWGHE